MSQQRVLRSSTLMIPLALFLGCNTGNGGGDTPPPPPPPVVPEPPALVAEREEPMDIEQAIRSGNTGFAQEIYNHVARDNPGEDIVFSPFSISTALSMVWLGARGTTADEMAQAMHFKLPAETHHPAWRDLLDRFSEGEIRDVDLRIANRLWGQTGYEFLSRYLEDGLEYYNAPLAELNFSGEPEPSRVTINDWVEEQTNNRIKDLIPPGAIDTTTRLVLTNAIYMKADWARPFQNDKTNDGDFTLADGDTMTVSYMNQQTRFAHGEWSDWQVLNLPYRGGRLAMAVLLPGETGALPEMEKDFDLEGAMSFIRDGLETKQVRVKMPRFRSELSLGLNEVLQSMGMRTAFGLQADFSGMSGNDDLYISSIVHKAFIEVDEEGTEAAAATAAVMAVKSMILEPEDIVEFNATHPFMYIIHDMETGAVLFFGRVMEPTTADD
ncbi:MAG: serpin family protein [Candidatus Sumerlaeia bacterium]|nr:serpin family protein [Candidatus Sumerlaeia bacterium]